jgi:serine protease AprX
MAPWLAFAVALGGVQPLQAGDGGAGLQGLTIQPSSGSVLGGEIVRITGSTTANAESVVLFGATLATTVELELGGALRVSVPTGVFPPETVTVTVTTNEIVEFATSGYTYENNAPIADPDPDAPNDGYQVTLGFPFSLDGSFSSDPDSGLGDAIERYEWDLNGDGRFDLEGPTPTVAPATLAILGIREPGPQLLRLQVTDRTGATAQQTTVLDIRAGPARANSVSPGTGSLTGGYDSIISGSFFTPPSQVFFGDTETESFTQLTPQTLRATVPAGTFPAGAVDIQVVSALGTEILLDGFEYLNDRPFALAHPEDGTYTTFGNAGLSLNGSASTDPNVASGDAITLYEWDIDGDGTFDRTGAIVELQSSDLEALDFTPGSQHFVTLRVTDRHGGQGQDTTTINVLEAASVFPNETYNPWIGDQNRNRIDDAIEGLFDADRANVIVIFQPGTNLGLARDRIASLSPFPPVTIAAINSICLHNVFVAAVRTTLANDPQVFRIELEQEISGDLDVSASTVRAAASGRFSPNTAGDRQVVGNGVNIAFLDSGVDDTHPSLFGQFVAGYDVFLNDLGPLGSQFNPDDDSNSFHGTHVAGVALSRDRTFRGVSPNARLIDVKVLDSTATGTTSNFLEGLQWCVDHKNFAWPGRPQSQHGIDVVNASLSAAKRSDGNDAICMMVDAAVNAGLTVVVSGGNTRARGAGCAAPAAADRAITVGSSDDRRTIDRTDDILLATSNFGPRTSDEDGDSSNELKPDLIAPGARIRSPNGSIAPLPGAGFTEANGSSLAAAHVAGAAALIIELGGAITPAAIKQILLDTAEPFGAAFDPALHSRWNQFSGMGLLDAFQALPESAQVPLEITSVSPSFGSVNGGQRVQILGRGLVPPMDIFFDGVLGANIVAIGGGVEVEVPPGSFPPGLAVDLFVRQDDGRSALAPSSYLYQNDPPIADADPDLADDGYFVRLGTPLALDGSHSRDPNQQRGDTIAQHAWIIASTTILSATPILDVAQLQAFGMNTPGVYTILLRVSDSLGATDEDTATVTVVSEGAPAFTRGDTNLDGSVDLADGIFQLGWLFLSSQNPRCFESADANGDTELDISDASYLFRFLFLGGQQPPPPYPECTAFEAVLSCEFGFCN